MIDFLKQTVDYEHCYQNIYYYQLVTGDPLHTVIQSSASSGRDLVARAETHRETNLSSTPMYHVLRPHARRALAGAGAAAFALSAQQFATCRADKHSVEVRHRQQSADKLG